MDADVDADGVTEDGRWSRLVAEHRARQRELAEREDPAAGFDSALVGAWLGVVAVVLLGIGLLALVAAAAHDADGHSGWVEPSYDALGSLPLGGLLGLVAALFLLLSAQRADPRRAGPRRNAGRALVGLVALCFAATCWIIGRVWPTG